MNEPPGSFRESNPPAKYPAWSRFAGEATFRSAVSLDALPDAEVLFGWTFDAGGSRHAFECADRLRWLRWGTAGVDAALNAGTSPRLSRGSAVRSN